MNRREFQRSTCAVLAALSGLARAQTWPTKPIKLITPTPAGSSSDAVSRVFANEMTQILGQSVIVENRPGANGITGTNAALSSLADGYTIFYVNVGTLAINPYLFPKQKLDPLKDSSIVGLSFSTANVLVARSDLKVNSVAELVAYGKANPGKLTMGSGGTGTTGHLSGELFKTMAGIEAVHVPYKGSSAAYIDLLAGRFDFMFDNLVSVGPYQKDGRVKVLAVTSAQRSDILPNVPTVQEAGIKGYETVSWGGYAAPKGTPPIVLQALRHAYDKANESAGMKDFMKQAGAVMLPRMSEEETLRFIRAEQQKWAAVVRTSGAENI